MDDRPPIRTIVFMDDDPRNDPHWEQIELPRIGIKVVAYVVPLAKVARDAPRFHRTVPIVTWEKPEPDREDVYEIQYHELFKVVRSTVGLDRVLVYSWQERWVPIDAVHGMPLITSRVGWPLRHFSGNMNTRRLCHLMHGVYPGA